MILKALLNNPYSNALKNIRELLDYDQKKKGVIMFFLLLANAASDVLGLTVLFALISAALDKEKIQSEWYLKYINDIMGIEDNLQFLFILSVIVFFIFLIKNAISILIFYTQAKFAFNISLRLSKKMFQYYYEQGFLYINEEDSGSKVYNIINVPYSFANVYIMQTLILSTELVVLLFIFIGIFFYDPQAIIVLLLVIIPTFILVYQYTKNKVKALGDERNKLYPVNYSTIWDAMAAYIDVKLGNKEQLILNNYETLQKRINRIDILNAGVYDKLHQKMNDVVLGLGVMVIFGFALLFRGNSEQIIAILSVFGLAAYRFLPSVNRMMSAVLALKTYSYLMENLKTVTNKKIYNFEEVSTMPFTTKISFDSISYTYPNTEQKVLNDLSFDIKKGETIGFIGSSGSGKTTLLNLLLRFLEETEGQIKIDGKPLTTENKASFQKNIGYVQQQVYIKNGTMKENIAFGETIDQINESKLQQAIEGAMLDDFVRQQPEGTAMKLGENGVQLSGGQKQRVGIARALYKDTQILVLDEATSALDMETEKAIVETINNLTRLNKTIFIVAHRITTLEECDRIYQLENGIITHTYNYQELYSKSFT